MNCLRSSVSVPHRDGMNFSRVRAIERRILAGVSIVLAMVFSGSAAHATYPVNDAAANATLSAALTALNSAVAQELTLAKVLADTTNAVTQLGTINKAMLTTGAPVGLNPISAVTPILAPVLVCPTETGVLVHPLMLTRVIPECNLMTATVTQLFTLTNAFIVEQNAYALKLQTLAGLPSTSQGVVLQTSLQVQILIASQQNRFNTHVAQVEGLKSKIRQHEREIKRWNAAKVGG